MVAEETLTEVLTHALRAAHATLRGLFGNTLPGGPVTNLVWSPGDRVGQYSAREFSEDRTDWALVRQAVGPEFERIPEWSAASRALTTYVEGHGIPGPGPLAAPTVDEAYLWPLLRAYLGDSRQVVLRTSSMRRAIRELLEHMNVRGGTYPLSATEIRRFVRFWREIHPVMGADAHYLQLPARRLTLGATRRSHEDALVDYVVGLEALLGRTDERAELGYKFRVRGSVLLARAGADRREHYRKLQRLYGLRSSVVHGQQVETAELGEMRQYAEECLRVIWKWFFRSWRHEPSNAPALERVDELLIG